MGARPSPAERPLFAFGFGRPVLASVLPISALGASTAASFLFGLVAVVGFGGLLIFTPNR